MIIKNPEISIIVLRHDRPEGLSTALQSIYSQSFTDYEVIIVDNGSIIDRSFDSIKDFIINKDNLRFLTFSENSPFLGKRLNQGLAIAKGSYVLFLMDDDFLEKDALKILHSSIKSGFDLVYGKVNTFDYKTHKRVPNSYSSTDFKNSKSIKINPIHITSVLIKKSIFNEIGGFREDFRRFFDLDLWKRVFGKYKTHRLDKFVSNVSVGDLASNSSKTRLDIATEDYKYPYIGYWTDRKHVSFSFENRNLINAITESNLPWVSSYNSVYDSDCSVSMDDDSSAINGMSVKLKYVDDSSNVSPISNIYSGVLFSTNPKEYQVLPNFVLRPFVSRDTVKSVNKIDYAYQKSLSILILNDASDIDVSFLEKLLNELRLRYNTVFLYFYKDSSIKKMASSIPSVLSYELTNNSFIYFKSLNIDVVVNLNSNFDNHKIGYDSFITGAVIKAPLVTYNNVSFRGFLDDGLEILLATDVQSFSNKIQSTKDIVIREYLVKNMCRKLHLSFLDDVVVNGFVTFLNSVFEKSAYTVEGDLVTGQDHSDSSVVVHRDSSVTQFFKTGGVSFNCVQFFGSVLSNQHSSVLVVIKKENEIVLKAVVQSYTLKNGVNSIIFEDIHSDIDDTFSITFSGSDPVLSLDKLNSILSVGSYAVNGSVKRSCLRFRILRGGIYVKI